MTNSLVSVIIPVYNAADVISATLDGVRQQSYQNWELVVVEDGSDTPSDHIVRQFASTQAGHRVEYIANSSNKGQAVSRNVGIEQAKGDFIALLDADDIWLPDYLSSQVGLLQEPGADIVFSTVSLFDSNSKAEIGFWGPSAEELENFQASIIRRNFIAPSATVFRREVFDMVGQFDPDTSIQGTEDYDFFLRALLYKQCFVHSDEIHCLYRKSHPGAATSNMPLIKKRSCTVIERHIDRLSDVSKKTKKRLLAARLYESALANLESDPNYAKNALHKGWRLNPVNLKPLLVQLSLKLPSKLRTQVRHVYRKLSIRSAE